MSMKLVTEVDRKYREWKSVIFLEDEIICIDKERERAIIAKMNDKEVLRVIRHLATLAIEELEWRKRKLIDNLESIERKFDELVSAAVSGTYYDRYEAESIMESIIKEMENINKLYDEVTQALSIVSNVYEHMYEVYDKLPDLIAIYSKSGLWV